MRRSTYYSGQGSSSWLPRKRRCYLRWRRWLSSQGCIHMFSRQSVAPAVGFRQVLPYGPPSIGLHLVSVLQHLRWCEIDVARCSVAVVNSDQLFVFFFSPFFMMTWLIASVPHHKKYMLLKQALINWNYYQLSTQKSFLFLQVCFRCSLLCFLSLASQKNDLERSCHQILFLSLRNEWKLSDISVD